MPGRRGEKLRLGFMNCCTEWSELEAFGLLTVMACKTRKSFSVSLPRYIAMSSSTHLGSAPMDVTTMRVGPDGGRLPPKTLFQPSGSRFQPLPTNVVRVTDSVLDVEDLLPVLNLGRDVRWGSYD